MSKVYVNDDLIDNALKFVLGETKPDTLDGMKTNLAKLHIACIIPMIKEGVIDESIKVNIEGDVCKAPSGLTLSYAIYKNENNVMTPFNYNNNLVVFTPEQITSIIKEIKPVTELTEEVSYNKYKSKPLAGGNKSHTKKYRNRNHSKSKKMRV